MTKDIKSEIDDFFLSASQEKADLEAKRQAERESAARKQQLAEDRFAEAVEKRILPAFEEFARLLEGRPITGEFHLDMGQEPGTARHVRPGIYFRFMKSTREVASLTYRHSASHLEMMDQIFYAGAGSPVTSPVRVDSITKDSVVTLLMGRLRNMKL